LIVLIKQLQRVAAGLVESWLGRNRESNPNFVRFYTHPEIPIEWSELDCDGVPTKYVWQRPLVGCKNKLDAYFATGLELLYIL
jgi:hypothetical protein